MADPVAVIVPHETVNDESVKVVRLLVAEGDAVTANQVIAEVETSKAVMALVAPVAGVARLLASLGQEVPIGKPLAFIAASADAPLPGGAAAGPRAAAAPVRPAAPQGRPAAEIRRAATAESSLVAARFTPLARRMADDAGLTLKDFHGLRIVRSADVQARSKGAPLPSLEPASEPAGGRAAGPAPLVPATGVEVVWEDLPRRKQVEIRQIAAGMARILPSSVTLAIPTRGLRAAVAEASAAEITSASVVIFETARLLRKYPHFNAAYDDGRAGFYQSVNIGMAIDDGSGLYVPVIRDADRKSLADIAGEARRLLERYIEKSLAVEDFVGATFTISDLSSGYASAFSPLVSQGQSAILGVGAEFFPPDASSGMFNVTLVFDHQLADGRMAAALLGDLAARLSSYEAARPQDQVHCSFCHRDAGAIRTLNGYLLRSGVPEGFVCSFCLGGF